MGTARGDGLHVDIAVLGAGPAGLIAASALEQRGCSVCVVGTREFGTLRPITTVHGRLVPVPVFPAINSPLVSRLGIGDLLEAAGTVKVQLYGADEKSWSQPASRASFAACVSPLAATLAEKLLGRQVRIHPLPELRKKVARQYEAGVREPRMGYIGGLSPYLIPLIRGPLPPRVPADCEAIDVRERTVHAANGDRIIYGSLVSTIPLPSLAALLDMRDLSFTSGGAQFHVLESEQPLKRNQLLYDCDPKSCVYRVFAATPRLAVTQLTYGHWGASPTRIAAASAKVIGMAGRMRPISRVALSACYPLDCTPEHSKAEFMAWLHANRIVPFGRLGSWQYLDLHELQWGRIDAIG